MARFDKIVQIVRATAGTTLTGLKSVVLNAGGSVILAGTSNAMGVICEAGTISAGRPVGVMLHGEIVEFGGTAGVAYYGGPSAGGDANNGTITTSSTSGIKLGFTVEGDRLVVDI